MDMMNCFRLFSFMWSVTDETEEMDELVDELEAVRCNGSSPRCCCCCCCCWRIMSIICIRSTLFDCCGALSVFASTFGSTASDSLSTSDSESTLPSTPPLVSIASCTRLFWLTWVADVAVVKQGTAAVVAAGLVPSTSAASDPLFACKSTFNDVSSLSITSIYVCVCECVCYQ